MSVSLLIIAHAPVGQSILDAATGTLGCNPLKTSVLDVERNVEPDIAIIQAQRLVEELDTGNGVLVLTDIYGSTPSNIACSLLQRENIRIVTGLNLPMLIRVMNYAALDLPSLSDKAFSGGHDGIIQRDPEHARENRNHA
jgi:mannose PTS system EIIA component